MSAYVLPRQSVYTGNLILVNAKHDYQEKENNDLIPVTEFHENIRMNRRAAILLNELMKKINGWSQIAPVSGWRSMEEQQSIWNDSLAENGMKFTQKFVAAPGHSEHQTGLAIDLGLKQDNIDFICPDFPYGGICDTFRRLAAGYGFIERYPARKESVTGIGHEPWHFRYVGIPHAFLMVENNLTLEEYTEFIKSYPYGGRCLHYLWNSLDISVSYQKAAPWGDTILAAPPQMPCSISGNNTDGFIITEWRAAK